MKKTIIGLASGLAMATGIAPAGAQVNFSGSDTLLDLTRALINDCRATGTAAQQTACNAIAYAGGGSTAGQTDLIAGTANPPTGNLQIIAPMSRELNSAACLATPAETGGAPRQQLAKGWAVSLDGLSLVANTTAGEICDTLNAGDDDPGTAEIEEFGANLVDGLPVGGDTLTLQDLAVDNGKPVNPARGRPADGINCKGCDPVTSSGGTVLVLNDNNDNVGDPPIVYTFANIKLVAAVGGVVTSTELPNTAWQDVLRILYTGAPNNIGATRIGSASGTGANLANTQTIEAFCGGDLRRSLVAQWQSIVDSCGSSGTCVGGVKRLLRRGDASGTTDTFLALLNLPSIRNNPSPVQGVVPVPGSPFCNGNDQRDNDPIRIACSVSTTAGTPLLGDMNCNRYIINDNGTPTETRDDEIINSLGLLLPIFTPEELTIPPAIGGNPALPPELPLPLPAIGQGPFSSTTQPQQYTNQRRFPRPACATTTLFARAPSDPDTGNQVAICPDGVPAFGGFCQVPTTSGTNGTNASCINKDRTNLPSGVGTWFAGPLCTPLPGGCAAIRPDGRVYNGVVRNPPPSVSNPPPAGYDGRVAQFSRVIVGSAAQSNRDLTMAVYRVRQTTRTPTVGTEVCTSDSSTLDIGCIAGNYGSADCSLGFAGREAADLATSVSMKINAARPTVAAVRDGSYVLSRKLFINTLSNTDAGNPDQFSPAPAAGSHPANLATFMGWLDANSAQVDLRADELGFVSFPLAAGGLQCVDFRANQLNPALPVDAVGNTCPTSDAIDACN